MIFFFSMHGSAVSLFVAFLTLGFSSTGASKNCESSREKRQDEGKKSVRSVRILLMGFLNRKRSIVKERFTIDPPIPYHTIFDEIWLVISLTSEADLSRITGAGCRFGENAIPPHETSLSLIGRRTENASTSYFGNEQQCQNGSSCANNSIPSRECLTSVGRTAKRRDRKMVFELSRIKSPRVA